MLNPMASSTNNGNVLKFLTFIEEDVKGKDLYNFDRLRLLFKLVTGILPLANIPSTIINILRRSPVIGLWMALGTNLITWWINDIFNPLIDKLNQYQTDDLKKLKEEVFSAILLCILERRMSDFEQQISQFEKWIEDMNTQNIVKTQETFIQTQKELFKTQEAFIQTQKDLFKLQEEHGAEVRNLKSDLIKLEEKRVEEVRSLNSKIDRMEKLLKEAIEKRA